MRIRLIVVSCVLAAAALLFVRFRTVETRPREITDAVPAAVTETAHVSLEDASSSAARVPMSAKGTDETVSPKTPLNIRRGTLVVVDQAGVAHEDMAADIEFHMSTEEEEETRTIVAARGRWEIDAGTWLTMRPRVVRVAGRHAVIDQPDDEWECKDIGDGVVKVHLPKPVVLHVRDAATKADVNHVTIVTGTTHWSGDAESPRSVPASARFERSGPSPITITYEDLDGEYRHKWIHARADGYAWGVTSVDVSVGGPYFVDLERAGALDVRIVGNDPALVTMLMVSPKTKNHAAYHDEVGSRDRISIDDIASGSYEVSVYVAPGGPALGWGNVDVSVGARSSIVVTCRQLPRLQPVSMGGIVTIPKEWNVSDFGLYVQVFTTNPTPGAKLLKADGDAVYIAKSDMQVVADVADTYSWTLRDVPVGSYRLSIEDPPMARIVSVGPENSMDIRMIATPPASVSIVLVDEQTGLPVRLPSLLWRPFIAGEGSMAFRDVKWSEDARAFVIRAPVGKIEIWTPLDCHSYVGATAMVDVAAGTNSARFVLTPQYEFGVMCLDGGEPVAFPRRWSIDVTTLEGKKVEDVSVRSDGHVIRVAVTSTGTFRVTFRGDDGVYDVPPPREFTIQVGVDTALTFDLARKR